MAEALSKITFTMETDLGFMLEVHGETTEGAWKKGFCALMDSHGDKAKENSNLFILFAADWLRNRGYTADVYVPSGLPLHKWLFAKFAMRVARWLYARKGVEVFESEEAK